MVQADLRPIQVIETAQNERLWVLETRNTAYAFIWNKHNRLENVYWGGKTRLP